MKEIWKDIKGYSSKYVGVYWNKKSNNWQSNIMIDGKIQYLGSFSSEYKAHLAYQNELNKLSIITN